MRLLKIDVQDGQGIIEVVVDDRNWEGSRLIKFAFEARLQSEQLDDLREAYALLLAENIELRKQLGHYAVGVPT